MNSISSRRLLKSTIAIAFVLGVAWACHVGYRAWQLDTLTDPKVIARNFSSMDRYLDTIPIRKSSEQFGLMSLPQTLPENFSFDGRRIDILDWIKSSGTTGLVVIADNKVAFEQYYQGNTPQTQAISWSIGKSFVSALIGFAVADDLISLDKAVNEYVPSLNDSGYAGVPIRDVLEMSSGIDFDENYADKNSGINILAEKIFYGRSTNKWIAKLKKKTEPGETFHYVSVDTQVLGMVLEAATGQKLASYMQEKLWSRLGPEGDALWLTDSHGTELAFCGLCMRTRDYARFGLLYLNDGRNLKGEQVLSPDWIHQSVTPRTAYLKPGRKLFQDKPGVPEMGYAYQFWIPHGEEGEFMAIGVFGQFIYVNPLRRVVIAKNSAYSNYTEDGELKEYEAIEAFREIARHVGSEPSL